MRSPFTAHPDDSEVAKLLKFVVPVYLETMLWISGGLVAIGLLILGVKELL